MSPWILATGKRRVSGRCESLQRQLWRSVWLFFFFFWILKLACRLSLRGPVLQVFIKHLQCTRCSATCLIEWKREAWILASACLLPGGGQIRKPAVVLLWWGLPGAVRVGGNLIEDYHGIRHWASPNKRDLPLFSEYLLVVRVQGNSSHALAKYWGIQTYKMWAQG